MKICHSVVFDRFSKPGMQIKDKIKALQEEIRTMQRQGNDSLSVDLDRVSYGDKVRELIKLRRQQIREGKKPRDSV